MQFYTLYDSKAMAYLPPFLSQNNATAMRSLEQAVNDPNHVVATTPRDYALFCLGEWDETTGTIDAQPPRHVCGAHELVRSPQPVPAPLPTPKASSAA